jgi:cytoskeletal protein RodZ
MTKYLSREQEARGTRNLFFGAIVVAVILFAGLYLWPFVFTAGQKANPAQPDTTARYHQTEGESVAGTTSSPSGAVQPQGTGAPSIQRNEAINATSGGNLSLDPSQRQAIDAFVKAHPNASRPGVAFTLQVGASVPRQAPLSPMPPEITQAVPRFQGDQFTVVGRSFVVVEQQSRRIVAIVPVKGTG